MENQTLIDILEHHFTQATQAPEIYKIRLRRTIDRLKSGFFLNRDEELIADLQALGFADVARQVRGGMYI